MDIWFERRNYSSQGWNKKRKAFLSLSWSFKDGKNLFPGKQKISPREKKTSVGSEEQRRWNSCAFSFFFPNIITSVSQLRNRTWSDKLWFCQWTQLNSSPEAGWAPEDLQTTDEDASERQLSLRISASVPVYGERKVRRSLIMEHHRCLLRVFVGLGSGVGTLPKVPPAQIALASFFVTCVSAPSKKNYLRGEKPAWACAENFYLLTCKSFSQVFLSKWAACIHHCTWIRLVDQLHQ